MQRVGISGHIPIRHKQQADTGPPAPNRRQRCEVLGLFRGELARATVVRSSGEHAR